MRSPRIPAACGISATIPGKVEHLDKDLFRRDLGDIIPAYEEIESRLAELAKSEGIEVAESTRQPASAALCSDAGFVVSPSFYINPLHC